MFEEQGIVYVKKEIKYSRNLVGDKSLYEGQFLTVVDIAVDDSGYLVLNSDGSGLGMIEKEDTVDFIPKRAVDLFRDIINEIGPEEAFRKIMEAKNEK